MRNQRFLTLLASRGVGNNQNNHRQPTFDDQKISNKNQNSCRNESFGIGKSANNKLLSLLNLFFCLKGDMLFIARLKVYNVLFGKCAGFLFDKLIVTIEQTIDNANDDITTKQIDEDDDDDDDCELEFKHQSIHIAQ